MRSFQAEADPKGFRPALSPDTPGSAEVVTPESDEGLRRVPSDRDFVAMRTGYRPTGGIARGDDLARLLEDLQRGDVSTLARLIASGDVFGFDWHGSFWVPMFQFDLHDLTVKPAARQVQAELAQVFDGWAIAVWFAQRNSWLDERKPVDLLDTELPAVLHAARADRFIVSG